MELSLAALSAWRSYFCAIRGFRMYEEALDMTIAREAVQEFHDVVMNDHREAMQALDCEEFLEKGILAFDWLKQAENTVREAIARDIIKLTEEGHKAFESLYYSWLNPCETAEARISTAKKNGYNPENLDRFNECCEQVRTWIEENEWRKRTRKAVAGRFSKEPW